MPASDVKTLRAAALSVLALFCVLAIAHVAQSQDSTFRPGQVFTVGGTLPGTCGIGQVYLKNTASVGIYFCTASNTWTQTGWTGGGSALPTGFVGMVASGACPSGTTEVSALNGKTLVGTLAANANVGTTGGSDSITPTINSLSAAAQAFTGSSTSTSAITAGTPAGTVAAPVFTGTVGTLAVTAHTVVATKQGTAAGNVVTTATHAITGIPGGTNTAPAFTGSALGTHSHTLTATGTNGSSAVTGTLNSFDPHPSFTRVIFCAGN